MNVKLINRQHPNLLSRNEKELSSITRIVGYFAPPVVVGKSRTTFMSWPGKMKSVF